MTHALGIVGAGNMAEAIVRGLLRGGAMQADRIVAADPSAPRRELFSQQLGVTVHPSADAVADADVILLAVKPQTMTAALESLRTRLDPRTLLVSIAAGISTASIERTLGESRAFRVVRAMPNTPMLVGEGAVGIAAGRHATPADLAVARKLFESSAVVIEVPEDKIDAVTALSGSGPAYVFFLVEQMTRAGVELGLGEADAELLARRTAAGAGLMVKLSPESPGELRRRVTSPGGTTQAAIEHLERRGWPTITREAIRAAEARGRELGR